MKGERDKRISTSKNTQVSNLQLHEIPQCLDPAFHPIDWRCFFAHKHTQLYNEMFRGHSSLDEILLPSYFSGACIFHNWRVTDVVDDS